MNPFAQRICIFYVDEDWANYIMNTIIEEADYCIKEYSKENKKIRYKDDTIIYFFKIIPNPKERGKRYSKAYIQNKDLDKNKYFIEQYIYPKLVLGDNPECYIINEYEDISKGHNITYKKWKRENNIITLPAAKRTIVRSGLINAYL